MEPMSSSIAIAKGIQGEIKAALPPQVSPVVIGQLVCATADLVIKSCQVKGGYLRDDQDSKESVKDSRLAVLKTFLGF
jgi:hypothetical protein